MINCGEIFHLELPPMPELSFHLVGSSVSSPFFYPPDYIGEAKMFLEGIYSLA